MRERNDPRFAEDAALAFAIYCDEAGLSLDDGLVLAEEIYDALVRAAEGREAHLAR